jgi:site-specific DNA recombinase
MIKCVIYARQSSLGAQAQDDGDTLSITAQLAACREFAARQGWAVAQEYHEQFSGLASSRPEFRRMLADLRAHAHERGITRVLVYKWSRFSRDPLTALSEVGLLRQRGIEVTPVADQAIGAGVMDEMMLFIRGTFDKVQVTDATEHSKAARAALIATGKLPCSGKARYGYQYDRDSRTRIIDEAAAKVVRHIFELFAAGRGALAVAKQLAREGIPSPTGRPRWSLKCLRDMVRDESYKGGAMHWGKTERVPDGPHYPCGVRASRPAGPGAPVGPPTPVIIDPATWEAANTACASRSRPHPGSQGDWLAGFVRCATCGVRLARYKHPRGHHYWRCPVQNQNRTCLSRLTHVGDRTLRLQVINRLALFLGDERIREAKLSEYRDSLADPGWALEAERNEQERAHLRAKVAKLLARFGDEEGLEDLLAQQVEALKAQLATREELAATLAERVALSRVATVEVDRVRLLLKWPKHMAEGPLGPWLFADLPVADKALVAKTVGLLVEVGRSSAGAVTSTVRVFTSGDRRSYGGAPSRGKAVAGVCAVGVAL